MSHRFDRYRIPGGRDAAQQLDSLSHRSVLQVWEQIDGPAGIDPGAPVARFLEAREESGRKSDLLLGEPCVRVLKHCRDITRQRGGRCGHLAIALDRRCEYGCVTLGECPPAMELSARKRL